MEMPKTFARVNGVGVWDGGPGEPESGLESFADVVTGVAEGRSSFKVET